MAEALKKLSSFGGVDGPVLTIVMDEFSVEIFEDGNVLSSTIYPPEDATTLTLSVKADSCSYLKEDV